MREEEGGAHGGHRVQGSGRGEDNRDDGDEVGGDGDDVAVAGWRRGRVGGGQRWSGRGRRSAGSSSPWHDMCEHAGGGGCGKVRERDGDRGVREGPLGFGRPQGCCRRQLGRPGWPRGHLGRGLAGRGVLFLYYFFVLYCLLYN